MKPLVPFEHVFVGPPVKDADNMEFFRSRGLNADNAPWHAIPADPVRVTCELHGGAMWLDSRLQARRIAMKIEGDRHAHALCVVCAKIYAYVNAGHVVIVDVRHL